MSHLNPVYAVIVPFLFIFTLPIALFASLTTALAFSVLFFRVLIVYVELALAVIPYYVLGLGHTSSSQTTNPKGISLALIQSRTGTSPPAARRRKRRSNSSSSNLSIKSSGSGVVTPTRLSDTSLGFPLATSVGPTRDYEGVGGWRLDNRSDEDEDALWTGINSRLELPSDHVRRHHRSLTGEAKSDAGGGERKEGGERSYSSENMMNTSRSRARTPTGIMGTGEGWYFAGTGMKAGKTARTGSGSSGSSKGSGEKGLSMKVW
jgi:hypothetical protein